MAERIAALILVLALAGYALARVVGAPRAEQRRPPHEACTPWMADCLPGVGAKRRAAAASAIRSGDLAQLPPAARPLARELFSGLE